MTDEESGLVWMFAGPWEYAIGAGAGALVAHMVAAHEERVSKEVEQELYRREQANSRLREAQRQKESEKMRQHQAYDSS